MKAGVITFPGSNCDEDLYHALSQHLGISTVRLWHKSSDLEHCDTIFLPGGFSYGDYLRSGAIARFSPIMQEVIRFAQHGGRVVGICNGFQILLESGLLPGALIRNASTLFICQPVHISCCGRIREVFPTVPPCQIPIAHAEGNYYCDDDLLNRLLDQQQVLFQYVDPEGHLTMESNPNGSRGHIAGICNADGNVIGMMPHPERAVDPLLGNTDGKPLLEWLTGITTGGN